MKIAVKDTVPTEFSVSLAEHNELLRHLLYHRGLREADAASVFLNPDYEAHTHDPFLMKGMEEAVSKIYSTIRANSRIVIFSDYDADGVPGGVILHDFFKKIGYTNFSNYIPHRHDEGFGLNKEAIEELSREGAKLIITVDCGIADAKEITHAKKHGMETIVTDHHLPAKEGAPGDAFCVLDPKQDGCAYPFKELCGAGVAFKLVQALVRKMVEGPSTLLGTTFNADALKVGWEKWLLDLVALATLSDMVPLVGENRVFAKYGLLVLRKSPRPGLQKLLRKAQVNQSEISEDDIVFSVTPKLNAASRLGSADTAFRLLVTRDDIEADLALQELLRLNDERKGKVGSLVREIKKNLAMRALSPVIVAGNPLWRPALLGLVANSIMREHARPVFLWGRDGDDCIKGSCRSDGSVSVMEIMHEARQAFVEYGGHAFSGGFTVVPGQVHTLEETLSLAYNKVGKDVVVQEETIADSRLVPDEVTEDNYKLIQKLAPFGQGNQKPVFLFENVQVKNARMFGKEKNHLEILLSKSNGETVKAIKFFAEGDGVHLPEAGARLSLLASFEKSSFGGRSELRLRIVDIL